MKLIDCIFFILTSVFLKYCNSQKVNVCDNVLGQTFRPDFSDCSKYHLCSPQKDWTLFCGPGMSWSQERTECVVKGSVNDTCSVKSLQDYKQKVLIEKLSLTFPTSKQQLKPPLTSPKIQSAMDRWSAKFFCPPGATGKHAHPSKCAQYYDCSKSNAAEWWGQNLRECPYPKVFDEITKECGAPSIVRCNTREMPIDPCDYLRNQCRSSSCLPCHIRYATCRGLPNGQHQWRGREMTSYFITCQNERVVFHGRCQGSNPGQYMIFSESLQTCVDRETAQTAKQAHTEKLLNSMNAHVPGSQLNISSNSTVMNETLITTTELSLGIIGNNEIPINQTFAIHNINQTPNQILNQTQTQNLNQTSTMQTTQPTTVHVEPTNHGSQTSQYFQSTTQQPQPALQFPQSGQNQQPSTKIGSNHQSISHEQQLRIPPSTKNEMTEIQSRTSKQQDITSKLQGINIIPDQLNSAKNNSKVNGNGHNSIPPETKPLNVFTGHSKMGSGIDILPVGNNLHGHSEKAIQNVDPLYYTDYGNKESITGKSQQSKNVLLSPETGINNLPNTAEIQNVRPIHPAMFSRSGISHQDQNNIQVPDIPASHRVRIFSNPNKNWNTGNENSVQASPTPPVTTEFYPTEVLSPATKELHPTEVMSADVIPGNNELSNSQLHNIEKVVNTMQSIGAKSPSIKQTPQNANHRGTAKVVYISPYSFSTRQKKPGATISINGLRPVDNNIVPKPIEAPIFEPVQESNSIHANQERQTSISNNLPGITFKMNQSNFPNSFSGLTLSDAAQQYDVFPARTSKTVNGNPYSDLIERLNFLGKSRRGRFTDASRLLPLATLESATTSKRRNILTSRHSKPFSPILP